MQILSWKEKSDLPQFREIFFESSARKTFENDEGKEAFFHKYTHVYLSDSRSIILGAWEQDKLLGYITLFPDSKNCEEQYELNMFYSLFDDQFDEYPAHLHINCHADARDKGVGSQLINEACELLALNNIAGVHLITAPDARNVTFYQKNNFNYSLVKERNGIQFLFLGRKLL
jgi:GNAT superfamily N-acetyltransferase